MVDFNFLTVNDISGYLRNAGESVRDMQQLAESMGQTRHFSEYRSLFRCVEDLHFRAFRQMTCACKLLKHEDAEFRGKWANHPDLLKNLKSERFRMKDLQPEMRFKGMCLESLKLRLLALLHKLLDLQLQFRGKFAAFSNRSDFKEEMSLMDYFSETQSTSSESVSPQNAFNLRNF